MSAGGGDLERLRAAGRRCLQDGQPAEAVQHFERALAHHPTETDLLEDLGNALRADRRPLPACKIYDQIIRLGRATASTWLAVGDCLFSLGEFAQSIAAFERCVSLRRGDPEAHHNLARARYRLGEVDAAVRGLRRADRLSDQIGPLLSLATIIPGAPRAGPRRIHAMRQTLARRLAGVEADLGWERPPPRVHGGHGDRIRIGYLSAYFDAANYMKPVWAVLNQHDRDRFELHLLSDCEGNAAAMQGFEKNAADQIHQVKRLTNPGLAKRIRELGIDVLVDLNAYSTPSRLGLFVRPAAPVVVAWFNSFATSALPGIDYIIGDDEVVSGRDEAFFSERVLRLPMSYLTFTVGHAAPPVAPLPPCSRGGHLTFGSLVAQYKITPRVIAAWSKILRGAPGSRLLLANRALGSAENRAWLAAKFEKRGVDSERLTLLPPAPHYQYLKYYDRIDIALDGFPYNGGTTTMEAIWQGVPVLTFSGDRWASRTSQTLLRRTHLGGFVSADRRAMVREAIRLASDPATPARLAELRGGMRDQLRCSSACDAVAATRAMEKIYSELAGRGNRP